METTRHVEVAVFDCELARARIAVAAARGDVDMAADTALEAAGEAIRLGQRLAAVILLGDAARCGAVAAAAERVRPLEGTVNGPLAPVVIDHLLAWAEGDARRLAAAAEAYAAIGSDLLAAEAAVAAVRARGDQGRRTALTVRAALLVERCAGCRTPVLDARPGGASLTPREHEVALLAAQGLT